MSPGRRGVLPLVAVRSGWGLLLLARPERAVALLGHPPDPAALLVVRVLGGRQVAQGALTLALPHGGTRAGVAVDVVHALTAAAWSATGASRRRAGRTSAVLALLLAAGGTATARSTAGAVRPAVAGS